MQFPKSDYVGRNFELAPDVPEVFSERSAPVSPRSSTASSSSSSSSERSSGKREKDESWEFTPWAALAIGGLIWFVVFMYLGCEYYMCDVPAKAETNMTMKYVLEQYDQLENEIVLTQ